MALNSLRCGTSNLGTLPPAGIPFGNFEKSLTGSPLFSEVCSPNATSLLSLPGFLRYRHIKSLPAECCQQESILLLGTPSRRGRRPRARAGAGGTPASGPRAPRGGDGGIYGGKGGHSSSKAFSPGGTQWKFRTISPLLPAAFAGRPTRLITGQPASAQLGSCHGKVEYLPKIPPKNHSSQKCNSDFFV